MSLQLVAGVPAQIEIPASRNDFVRFSANALGQVDLVTRLLADQALYEVLLSFGLSDQPELQTASDGSPIIFESTADGWDSELTVASASPDDFNIPENPSFYESRGGIGAPIDGTFVIEVQSDDDVEVVVTFEVAPSGASLDSAESFAAAVSSSDFLAEFIGAPLRLYI